MLAHLAIKRGHRGGEHHCAALAVFHGVCFGAGCSEQAGRVVGADQIDVDDSGEVFQRGGVAVFADHTFGRTDAGNVHQDASGALRSSGLFNGRLHALGAGDIAWDGHGAAVSMLCVDVGRHALGVLHVHVEHGHFGA